MQARARPGSTPPTALRLAEVASELHMLRASVDSALREYEQLIAAEDGSADELSSMPYALKINNLKVAASRKLPEIVGQALLICGIMGYKNDSKFSMSRHLRDAHSGALMVGNDRILATNSSMLLVLKDE
jgi:acyl-CoA dehydrogenase